MPVKSLVRPQLYKDSVVLMRISEALSGIEGVKHATVMMGTAANKQILEESDQLTAEVKLAGPDDLMIVLEADSGEVLNSALTHAEGLLSEVSKTQGEIHERPPRTASTALARLPEANLVQVSTPGQYAGAEALKALRHGLHVFLFSDNVSLEQEIFLKTVALRKGLLVMGPDCGTSLIGGTPLGFANVTRRGTVGLVAASGTGLQQVTCLIHQLGEGVSNGIGTGSRDLAQAVGGITTQQGLEALSTDPQTRVIVLISKPPSPNVAARILERVQKTAKPVVVLFLGGDSEMVRAAGAIPVVTLEEAAIWAVALARGEDPQTIKSSLPLHLETVQAEGRRFNSSQRYLRGLFSGGTFCIEAQIVCHQEGLNTFSNVPLDKTYTLANIQGSKEHTAIDMGSDEFTVGRPHPMIDFRYRVDRLFREAQDPTTAVILIDVVLGYGAHPDPAAALAPAIQEAKRSAQREGRYLIIVGSVCGTEEDPQHLSAQEARLREAGMLLASSNASAARLAAAITTKRTSFEEAQP